MKEAFIHLQNTQWIKNKSKKKQIAAHYTKRGKEKVSLIAEVEEKVTKVKFLSHLLYADRFQRII